VADVDLFSEVKASGVFTGFEASARGSVLTVSPGHARLNGKLIPGGWAVDMAGNAPGWWAIIAGPDEALITQDLHAPGLPLWLLLLEENGRMVVGRDLRRRCLGIVWEAGSACAAPLPLDEPLSMRRIQAATGEVDGCGTPYWTDCVVTANVAHGQVLRPAELLEVTPHRTTAGQVGLVLEGYDA
jgi:hypothetical protein